MAVITFSPLIVRARGKVGDTVFSSWKGISYIRSRVTPSNPRTTNQTKQRNKLKWSVLQWQSLATDIKLRWNEYASPYSRSGFNMWSKFNIPSELHVDDLQLRMTPANKDVAGPTDFAAVEGASAGEINCTWVEGLEGAGIYIEIYAFKEGSTFYDTAPEQLSHESILSSVNAATVTAGTPGGVYQVVGFIVDTNITGDTMSQSYHETDVTAKA